MKTMKIHLRALAILLGAALITGCAGSGHVGESWQCPLAQGTACQSVAEADPAVRAQGEVLEIAPSSPIRSNETTGAAFLSSIIAWFADFFRLDEEEDIGVATAEPLFVVPEVKTPNPADETLRTKERIARIWIAPYVDPGGVYREGGWVRVVVRPAGWRLP
ncbi:MAG: type IV conjugative transfer system lipoprotein TraV [Nitrospinae bacterium]|nr:type IV conjugative transfer system lipoprotein TraV [Nitrospinota bacterium]